MVKHVLLLMTLFFSLSIFSVKGENYTGVDYEIEGAGVGAQGTYLVKVTVISKKSKVQNAQIARCAVHGVLFRGFANKELRQNQKPLAGGPASEAQHADFYKEFFAENGMSKNYVSAVNGSQKVIKSGKEYKISAIVSVNKDQLVSDLKAAGVIKGLNSAF
ncbi:MAG: hypothetical protein IKV32_05815 [Muribaculaceae bacterium]|nr:hypothetical protein [Muribaculaceae bacterium]